MLNHLTVRNFALIEHLNLDWQPGFTSITGETGSGKSILLAAIQLILGDRADFSVIGKAGDKSIVEAEFDLTKFNFNEFFAQHDLDYAPVTCIRREISKSGKSRAFINDTPVSLTVLRELTERLIHIHSQYNTLELKNKSSQLGFFDTLAGLDEQRETYTRVFRTFQTTEKRYQELIAALDTLQKQQDYARFQLEELASLCLDERTYDSISQEYQRVEHSGELSELIHRCSEGLTGDEGVVDQLRGIQVTIEKNTKHDPALAEWVDRINAVRVELRDLSDTMTDLLGKIELDPAKLLQLGEQLDAYNRALVKHRVSSQLELTALYDSFKEQVHQVDHSTEQIAELERELSRLRTQLDQLANELHRKRAESVAAIESEITTILTELKLPDTKLSCVLSQTEEFNAFGNTSFQFLFSANKGIPPVSIDRAASGGELSRVMLALQKMISYKRQLPTLFFDEIDTGVSGDVAQKIGKLLSNMSDDVQVIAITHLPQVAARAVKQLKVSKSSSEETTTTLVRYLSDEERVEEVARLMSGEQISAAAMANARELMN
jgi:DNA repair protein RecN (Recombination protein N)